MKKRPKPVVSGGRPPRPINLPRKGNVTRRNEPRDFKQQMLAHPVRWSRPVQSDDDEPEAIA